MLKSKRIWKRMGCLVLALLVGYFCLHFWQTRGWEKACGTYLVGGGESYITITGKAGWLKMDGYLNLVLRNEGGGEHVTQIVAPTTFTKTLASFSNGCLELRQMISPNPIFFELGGVNVLNISSFDTRLVLVPSPENVKDWNLQKVKYVVQCHEPSRIIEQWKNRFRHPSHWFDRQKWVDFFRDYRRPFSVSGAVDYAPPKPTFVSYLHRVDDPALIPYMEERFKNQSGERVCEMARGLHKRHPQDIYLTLHCAEMEAMMGNVQEAEKLWAQWVAVRDTFPDAFLQIKAKGVWNNIYMARMYQKYPDFIFALPGITETFSLLQGVDWTEQLVSKKLAGRSPESRGWMNRWGDLKDQEAWLCDMGKMNARLFQTYPLVPPIHDKSGYVWIEPNAWALRTLPITFTMKSYLHFFAGEGNEMLPPLLGIYTLGGLLKSDVGKWIGISMQMTVLHAFEFYLLNACQTSDEVADFKKILDGLTAQDEMYRKEYFVPDTTYNYSYNDTVFMRCVFDGNVLPGFFSFYDWSTEYKNRLYLTNVNYDLLKTVAAGRYHLMTTGEFPKSSADFAPVLPGGLPTDVFCTSSTLKFNVTSDTLHAYSVGPDGVDDGGSIMYDTTNGTKSRGDVIRKLPRKSQYPYQPGGVRAKDAADFLRQYPNGLPEDLFASDSHRPLSILDSGTTEPLRLFSVGPSGDESTWDMRVEEFVPPGATSTGENVPVWGTVPPVAGMPMPPGQMMPAGGAMSGETGWAYPPNPRMSYSKERQRIYLRQDKPGQPEKDFWVQPSYDPTNGARSLGTLQLDIPKP